MKALLQKIRKLLKDRRIRETWHRSVSVFAAVVVFITTYALVLPAITLEKTADCGIEEHQHDESCYESRLICGMEESQGHHHDESCFSVTQESVCGMQEHQHSVENGCYDEQGNLICEIQEHVHDESCFRDLKTLTCSLEESEGHHHTDACYEKVLVCGKEVHTHSSDCYKEDNSAAAAEEAAGGSSTAVSEEQGSSASDEMPEESVEKETAGMTGATEEAAAAEPFVPQLDPLNMDAMMTKDTGIYYFHAEENEDIPSNSAGITDWQKVKDDTKLAPTDLVKVYLAYKIPAGSLNESNPTARYRLPGNIHLTDDQIDAINHTRNGVYASMDGEEAGKYLGAEAVEGDRKPDEELRDGAQEYISAVVRAENVYDGNGHYLGQDLIFTFVPYTIEKNRNTCDADGNQLTAGDKVTGWFACDFNMSQIDWVEQEADPDNNTAEKTAELVFVENDGGIGTKEISTILTLVETDDDGNSEGDSETASAEETGGDASAEEEASPADTDDTASDAGETDTVEYQSGTLTAEGDGYKITLDYTEEAKIPENAELSVKEITPETDREAYEACLEQAKKQVTGDDKSTVDETASRFFDIEIVVRNTGDDGSEKVQKIEPAAPVGVNIQITDTSRNADSASGSGKTEQSDPTVLHFAEEGVEQIDSTVKAGSEQESGEGQNTEVQFEAESFSVYGVVYTVDFHWEVDGKEYEYSLAGGDTISFRELAGILGVVSGDSQDSNNDNATEGTSDAAEGENSAKDSENSSAGAEETAEFIDGVSEIRFSNESLVKVARITDEITAGGTVTAGALKARLGLECEYSTELTEIQREAMDSKEFRAPDWALISLKAFDTEEYLTVEMKNGESFRIKVTDAKISKNILTADGENYIITIVYRDDAEIPSDAELNAAEILPSSEKYQEYVDDSAEKLNVDGQDIAYARFFDIEIVSKGEKIEPKAPVQVIISHKDALDVSLGDTLSIVHFADEGTEVISDVTVSEDQKEISYEQASFSVVGEVKTNPTQGTENNPRQYALVVKYDGTYYSIDSDGTLTPVDVNNPDNPTTVTLGSPMLWSYDQNGTIYHHTDATDVNAGQIAADFYYKYLDLNQEFGTYEEEKIDIKNDPATNHWLGQTKDGSDVTLVVRDTTHPIGNKYAWTVQTHKKDSACRVSYNTSTHILTNQAGTYVLDVGRDDNNVLRIVRRPAGDSSGLPVYFCDVSSSVPNVSPYNHTVSHIDISIEGSADIQVPLAYGTYYDADGNPVLKIEDGIYYEYRNGNWSVIEGMDDAHPITVHKDFTGADRITGEDIKSATITATDIDGNVLPDSFGAYYITGYSMNAPDNGEAEQVRIEGSFKVCTLDPISSANGALPNDAQTCANRKATAIKYTVNTVKHNQELAVTYNNIQLYNGHGEEMKLTTDITISSVPFTYWDLGNKCPPLWSGNNPATWQDRNGRTVRWQDGAIYTAPGYMGEDNSDWWLSGIDFRLSGDQVEARAEVPGLEVTKYILDDEGNQIALDPETYDDNPLETIVHVYEKASPNYESDDVLRLNGGDATRATGQLPAEGQYSDPTSDPAHADLYNGYSTITNYDFDVEVGLNGKGLDHNYHVTEGMYYIEEDKDSVARTIVGADGTTYRYLQTHIESEYAWRDDEYVAMRWGGAYNEPVHVSPNYTDLDPDAPAYRSIPEVLGNYKDKDGSWVQENGAPVRNTMLPFYIYNVYIPDVKLDVEKKWVNIDAPDDAEVTVELYYAKRKVRNADGTAVSTPDEWPDKSEYVKVDGATWENTEIGTKIFEDSVMDQTPLTLRADDDETKNWKGSFQNLPHRLTDAQGNVWEFDYFARETAVLVGGENMIGEYEVAEQKTEPTAEEAHLSDGLVTIINARGSLQLVKKWLRSDGETEYTPSGSGPESSAVITAQLRRRRTVEGTETTTTERLVTVTIQAKDTYSTNPYNNGNPVKLWEGQVVEGSDLYFSVACNGTSNPYNANGNYATNNSSSTVDSSPVSEMAQTITYKKPMSDQNTGITKDPGNVFVLRNAADGTVITASFGAKSDGSHAVRNDSSDVAGFGYYIVEADTTPETTTTTTDPTVEDEPVTIEGIITNGEIVLNKDNNWSFSLSAANMEPGWEYYINTDPENGPVISETGVSSDYFTFNAGPSITTDDDNNTVYACTNTSKTGSLIITKEVTVNGTAVSDTSKPSPADGTYTFTVTRKGDSSFEPRTIAITITNGVTTSSDALTELFAGTYVVTELPSSNGTTLTRIDGETAASASKEVTVTAGEAGSSATVVTFTNNIGETEITVKKVDAEKAENNVAERYLDNARFSLFDSEGHVVSGISSIKITKLADGEEIVPDEENKFTIPISGIKISGLPDGSYQLVEREPPDGYVITTAVTTFTVSQGSVTEWSLDGTAGTAFEIPNPPGAALPHTGGTGTRLHTILGLILIAGAGMLLLRRRIRV